MAFAQQSTREFKGDHISAKMFRQEGKKFARTVPVFDAVIENGSFVLTSATASFQADDVGAMVIVHQPDFAGLAHKSTIVSVEDPGSVTMAEAATLDLSGAKCDIGPDDTNILLYALIPPGYNAETGEGAGSGIERLIPKGCYLVTPGELIIPDPQSGILRGQGSRFATIIRSNDPDSALPVLQLGNGIREPHSWVMQNLTISKGYGPGPALFMSRTQLMVIRDVIVTDLGIDGIGIDTEPNPSLFGEVIFDHVGIGGGDGLGGFAPAGSIGMRIHATSNVSLFNCNIEDIYNGLVFTGATQCKLTMLGGRFERVHQYALLLSNCQPNIETEVHTGHIWLGHDVVGGSLNIYGNAASWTNGSLVDNGFGNRVWRMARPPRGNQREAIFGQGVRFDGDEWLRVDSLVEDPTFMGTIDQWSATGATVELIDITMPGATAGRSIAITDSGSGGGYASITLTAEQNTDYCLHVGLLTQYQKSYRILVSDSGGTLWDSGVISYGYLSPDWQSYRVIRKRIATASNQVITVRIYAVEEDQITICPLLLFTKSQIRMADYISSGAGLTVTGSGSSLAFVQDISVGHVYTFKTDPHVDLRHRWRCFFRAVVSAPEGSNAHIGIGERFNFLEGGAQVQLRVGDDIEYVVPLMSPPKNSQVIFYGILPEAGATITVKDAGLFYVQDDPNEFDHIKIRNRTVHAIDEDGNIQLPVRNAFSGDTCHISNYPGDGTIKPTGIVSLTSFSFGANQGTIAGVNSRFAGFPNWEQTSRIYSFTASAAENLLSISLEGYPHEGFNVPFTGESLYVITSSASGMTVGTNYWLKAEPDDKYSVWTDPALTLRVTLGNGSGTGSQSSLAMFLQLATSMFGIGFGDATNDDGVTPWATDTDNAHTAGPPFAVVSRRNSLAVKETARNSGVYTGYPIFPMYSGGSGIFYSAGDPTGLTLWSGGYPPRGSICLRGDGGFSVRVGPIPGIDDGSGWANFSSLMQLWTVFDVNTIRTIYRVQITDPSDSRAVGVLVTPTSHLSQAATPLYKGSAFEVDYQGRITAASIGINASAPTTNGYVHVNGFLGVGAAAPLVSEIFRVSGVSRLLGETTVSGNLVLPALTASRAAVINASSELATSAVTATELAFLSGVSSAIQTQLNALDARIDAIEAALPGKSDVGHGHTTTGQTPGSHDHGGAVPADGAHTHDVA